MLAHVRLPPRSPKASQVPSLPWLQGFDLEQAEPRQSFVTWPRPKTEKFEEFVKQREARRQQYTHNVRSMMIKETK